MKLFYRFALVSLLLVASVASAQFACNQVRAQATTAALAVHSDNVLKMIQSYPPLSSTGTSSMWVFVFYSASSNTATMSYAGSMNQAMEQPAQSFATYGTLPATVVDSPTIYAGALTHGGSAFLTANPSAQTQMIAISTASPAQNLWAVTFTNTTTNAVLYVYYDSVTGAFLQALEAPEAVVGLPGGFNLEQNYPNPFNPSTSIQYSVPKSGHVTLKVFNTAGREVATLVDGFRNANSYKVEFNASNLPSGVYFYTLTSGTSRITQKMVLSK